MLAAVEMWRKRDHDKEIKVWTQRLEYIQSRLKNIPGVTLEITQPKPNELSNPSPDLHVRWDMSRIPMTGFDVEQALWNGEPRVAVSGMGSFLPFPPNMEPNILINTSQLNSGEEKIIAERVYDVLSKPTPTKKPAGAPAFDISGEWDVLIKFAASEAHHKLVLSQQQNDLTGTHSGSLGDRNITGTLFGRDLLLRSSYKGLGVRVNFEFTGTANSANEMKGKLSMCEYGNAEWVATKK
jgi:hypothetical protein